MPTAAPDPAPDPTPPTPPIPTSTPPSRRRRGPQPRHSREDVARAAVALADANGLDAVTFRAVAASLGTGVMSLYSYIPDKQTLVFDMYELVSAELDLPAPTGDWRADMHVAAGRQRDLAHRHPWMVEAVSHLQPLGPATLDFLEFALGALEPTGLSERDRLETIALVNGFVLNIVRAELESRAAAADPQRQTAQYAMIPELLATGRYPRFAAAMAGGGEPETWDPAVHFDRLLDRILDGLVRAPSA
jgi:AcrR family transcriptional regulator